MNKIEEKLLDIALEHKKKYTECPWWRFKKKREHYRDWQNTLSMLMRMGRS